MIFKAVPPDVEIVPCGHAPHGGGRKPLFVSIYSEFMGGLGDVVLRMHETGCYSILEAAGPESPAAVILMSHNPYVRELFEWHPKRDHIRVYDLGFDTPFHPWENTEWRIEHGIPPVAIPSYPQRCGRIRYYPSDGDLSFVSGVPRPYIVISVSAGDEDRALPEPIRESVADWVIGSGFHLVVVGRSEYRRGRSFDIRQRPNVIDATDLLSVPGVFRLIEGASGVVSSHTSVFHMAIEAGRPTMLIYPDFVKRRYVTRGPIGYMKGIDRPGNDHMEFGEYTEKRMADWISKLRGAQGDEIRHALQHR